MCSKREQAPATDRPFAGDADDFAKIDLISNHTVFKEPDYYWDLLRKRDLPVETFSSFIHEATHHWCFSSPVGLALTMLFLSAGRQALRWLSNGTEANRNRTLDDLLTFDIVFRFLGPLNEGLAQFAEYDVLPSESTSLISPPMLSALTHLFNAPRLLANAPKEYPTRAAHEIRRAITQWRLSRQTIERKSELLLQPIGSDGSNYLLGYLTIKQLWRSASRFYPELRDADVFMMLVRKLIYGDHALAAEILDRKKTPRQRGLGFGRQLYERLRFIRSMHFSNEVPWSEWEKLLEPPERNFRGPTNMADGPAFAALDTQKQVKKGMALRLKFVNEVMKPLKLPLGKSGHEFPPDYFLDLINERHLMWLGNLDAKWESTGPRRGRVVRGEEVLFDNYDLTEMSDEGLDKLTLDIYVDLYENYQLTTIGNGKFVFGFAHAGNLDEISRSRLMKNRMDRSRLVGLTNVLQGAVRGYVGVTNYRFVAEEFWNNGGRELLDETYLDFALDSNDKAIAIMKGQGIAGALGNDGDLVRNVAAISLGASVEMSPERLKSVCTDFPLDPLQTIQRVKDLWTVDKLPLASVRKDGFLDSAF